MDTRDGRARGERARARRSPIAGIALAIALSAACTAPDPEPPTNAARIVDGPFAGEVEASCAGCGFGIARNDCELAVRIDGRVLDVVGTGIDDHGDAHAPDGFCNAVRRARVSGRIDGDRFVADTFELLPSAAR